MTVEDGTVEFVELALPLIVRFLVVELVLELVDLVLEPLPPQCDVWLWLIL